MEYRTLERFGANEGFPVEGTNRNAGRYSRGMNVSPSPVPHEMDARDMEFEIHCIETDAYSAVLKAFIAQSEVLSWGKEGLMTDLRKELRVSDIEHREILAKVNLDESVRTIREWRKGAAGEKRLLSNTSKPGAAVPSSSGQASCKRLRTLHDPVSISQNYLQPAQPSPAVISSTMAMHLSDGQRVGEGAMFSNKASVEESRKLVYDSRQASIAGQGTRQVMVHSTKAHQTPDANNLEKRSHVIRIRATDELIQEVERVISSGDYTNNLAKAKVMLKEHEQAIIEALDTLAEVLDDDNSPGHAQLWHTYDGQQKNGHKLGMQQPYMGRFPATNFVG